MKEVQAMQSSSFAALFDPAVARAVAERAAQWNLPRHNCRPLDRYAGSRVSADLARYDEAVELAAVPDDELPVEIEAATSVNDRQDADFDDDDL
jgi:hypothetical protein